MLRQTGKGKPSQGAPVVLDRRPRFWRSWGRCLRTWCIPPPSGANKVEQASPKDASGRSECHDSPSRDKQNVSFDNQKQLFSLGSPTSVTECSVDDVTAASTKHTADPTTPDYSSKHAPPPPPPPPFTQSEKPSQPRTEQQKLPLSPNLSFSNNKNNNKPPLDPRSSLQSTTLSVIDSYHTSSTTFNYNNSNTTLTLEPPRRVSRTDTVQSSHRRSAASFAFSTDSLHLIHTVDGPDKEVTRQSSSSQPPLFEVQFQGTNQGEDDDYSSQDDDSQEDNDDIYSLSSSTSSSSFSQDADFDYSKPENKTVPSNDVNKERSASSTGQLLPWMLDWVAGTTTSKPNVAVVVDPPLKEKHTPLSTDGQLDKTPVYFATQPIPMNTFATDDVQLSGWAAVSSDKALLEQWHNGRKKHAECLTFCQMLPKGTIRMTRGTEGNDQEEIQLSQIQLQVESVSDSVGYCLTICGTNVATKQDTLISILPVLASPYQIAHSNNQEPKENVACMDRNNSCRHENDSSLLFAPVEQHDAVMHWRFALDFCWSRWEPSYY